MTDEETSLFAEACEYLRPHSCDCENITCTGANVKELVAQMQEVLEERRNHPPASSILLIEKKSDEWLYVVTPGPMTAGGPRYATKEEAQVAAEQAIVRQKWPLNRWQRAVREGDDV